MHAAPAKQQLHLSTSGWERGREVYLTLHLFIGSQAEGERERERERERVIPPGVDQAQPMRVSNKRN